MMDSKRRGLGMGLSALLGEDPDDLTARRAFRVVPIEHIQPGRYQPRRNFDEAKLADLADSIRIKGVLQPLVVRADPNRPQRFELIAGERRWRAAQRAQLHEVPVIVRDLSDREALEIALVENLQREDLSPIDEAEAYGRLMAEFGHTQEELARALGKSRSHVANTARLLNSTDKVRAYLTDGTLTAGHARAILGAANPDVLADQIVARGLTVRQAEALAARPIDARPAAGKSADTLDLERQLSERWGMRVQLRTSSKGGSLIVQYRDLDQLDAFLARVG